MLKKIYDWSSSWTGTIVIVLSIIFFVAQAFVIPSGSMKNTLLIGDMLFVKKFVYGIPTPRIPWLEVKVLPDFNNNGHLIAGDGPKRGDIVVFRYPKEETVHYVKRCVAVGGDMVAVQEKHLLLHPHEGNDYVKKNYPITQILEYGNKLWIKDPYKKEHPGIHQDPTVQESRFMYPQLFNFPVLNNSFVENFHRENLRFFGDFKAYQIPEGEYFMMGDNRDHSNDSRFWGTVPYKDIVGTPWFIYFSWDEDYKIRWNRVFRSVEGIEKDMEGKKVEIHHKEGIY